MKILFIGDIVGKIGREMIKEYLPLIKQKYNIDVAFANAENVAHGKGITKKSYDELILTGLSLLSMGNHTYAKKEIFEFIDEANRLVVPENRATSLPGVGSRSVDIKGKKVRLTNVLGQSFMAGPYSSPYDALDRILLAYPNDIHIVDFHGETTSEKMAFAFHYDGRIQALLGTHTHVQTADNRRLLNKTVYITDVGMTGAYYGIIGQEVSHIINRMKTGISGSFELAKGEGQLSAVIITIDDNSNQAINIERLLINPDHPF